MECVFYNNIDPALTQKQSKLDSYPIYVTNKSFDGALLDLDDNEKKRINEEVFNLVINWGDKEFLKKKLKIILNIENYQLWFYQRFRVYFEMRNIFYEIAMLEKIKNLGYDIVYLYSSYEYERSDFICEMKIVKFSDKKCYNSASRLWFLKYGFIFVIRAVIGKLKLSIIKNKFYVFINSTIKQNVVDSKGDIKKDNPVLSYLFDILDDDALILNEMPPPKSNSELDSFCSLLKFKREGVTEIPAESILAEVFFRQSLRKKYNRLYQEVELKLRGLIKENKDPINGLVLGILLKYTPSNKYFISRFIGYQYYFEKNVVKSVTTTDENGPSARSILDAAKLKKVKTFGIQHGGIHSLHPNYVFNKYDKNQMPDYTFVWGNKWREFLKEKGGFLANKIRISGMIRTDIVPKLQKNNSTSEKLQIVFATQPQRDAHLRYQTARDVFRAVKKLINVSLKVKLHPAERNDKAYYYNIAKDVGLNSFIILGDADLYLILNQSDVVITSFSTVGTEAIFFKKPLIIYDPLKQDLQSYCKEGVGLQSINSDDIFNYLFKIQEKLLRIDIEKYNTFIKYNAYKIDGKSSIRTYHFIKELS